MIALCPSPWKNTGMDVVLFGTGWRARFFLRIARLCPSIINVVSVYSRSPERAKEIEALGFRATADRDKALEAGHDAVIVAAGKEGFADTLRFLRDNGERIISETSYTISEMENFNKEINTVGRTKKDRDLRRQVKKTYSGYRYRQYADKRNYHIPDYIESIDMTKPHKHWVKDESSDESA